MTKPRNPWDDSFWQAHPRGERREGPRRWDDDLSRIPAFFAGMFFGVAITCVTFAIYFWFLAGK